MSNYVLEGPGQVCPNCNTIMRPVDVANEVAEAVEKAGLRGVSAVVYRCGACPTICVVEDNVGTVTVLPLP